jgi:rare lipoprotein A
LIGLRLIAPCAGATAAACVVAVAGSAAASNQVVAGPTPSTGATGVTSAAPLAGRVLSRDILVGHRVTVSGAVAPALGSQTVVLEQLRRRGGWRIVARSVSSVSGPFSVAFRPRQIGVYTMRLQVASATSVYDTPATRVNVFHEVLASWYAPGGITACGEVLTASTLGVANKTLPCGTIVTLIYRHRIVRVPVIDRGPFVAGRDYDLTLATKEKLGAGDLTYLWANR